MTGCTEDADCGQNSLFRLAGGICDTETGICDCNEGFDGFDSWEKFNNCHIDENVRQGFRAFLVVLGIINFIVTIVTLVVLALEERSICMLWFTKQTRKKDSALKKQLTRKYSDDDSDLTGMGSAADDKEELEGEGDRNNEFRQRNTTITVVPTRQSSAPYQHPDNGTGKAEILTKIIGATNLRLVILVVVFFIFSIFYTAYVITLEFRATGPTSRAEDKGFINFCFALASGAVFGSSFLLSDFYYSALPDLRLYGKLININNIMIRNPKLYHYICDFYGVLCFSLPFLFGFVLPTFDPDNFRVYSYICFACFVFLGVSQIIMTVTVLRFVFKSYHVALVNIDEYTKLYEQKIQDIKEGQKDLDLKLRKGNRVISLFENDDDEDKDEIIILEEKIMRLEPQKDNIKKAKRIANFVILVMVFLVSPGVVVMCLIPFYDYLFQNQFLYFGFIEVFACCFVLTVSLQILYRVLVEWK